MKPVKQGTGVDPDRPIGEEMFEQMDQWQLKKADSAQ